MPDIMRYIRDNGQHCLFCGSDDLHSDGINVGEDDMPYERVTCGRCNNQWIDFYKIDRVQLINSYSSYRHIDWANIGDRITPSFIDQMNTDATPYPSPLPDPLDQRHVRHEAEENIPITPSFRLNWNNVDEIEMHISSSADTGSPPEEPLSGEPL